MTTAPSALGSSSARAGRTGVLVMAHGTPSPGSVEAFYTSIRRGRPPSPDQLCELEARYRAIGGTSPLAERTDCQVAGLGAALERTDPGRYPVAYGSKHTAPSIEEGAARLARAGVERIVGLVLTPHRSSLGSGEYLWRAGQEARRADPPVGFVAVESWHRAPGLAPLFAERTNEALSSLPPAARRRVAVFFTAHSLPVRAVPAGDSYPQQVAESALDVATLLDWDTGPEADGGGAEPSLTWSVAWQSAGRTPEPWLGPDLISEIGRAAAEGATAVVVCPVGFVADHLEILYDLDIEARHAAEAAGLAFSRARALNDDHRFLELLADVVRRTA